MDADKDGIISKSDLRSTFDAVGKLSNEKELDEMINEAPGPLNFTQLLSLFAIRMQDSGGTDDDDVVVAAFRSFDESGTIDGDRLVLFIDMMEHILNHQSLFQVQARTDDMGRQILSQGSR